MNCHPRLAATPSGWPYYGPFASVPLTASHSGSHGAYFPASFQSSWTPLVGNDGWFPQITGMHSSSHVQTSLHNTPPGAMSAAAARDAESSRTMPAPHNNARLPLDVQFEKELANMVASESAEILRGQEAASDPDDEALPAAPSKLNTRTRRRLNIAESALRDALKRIFPEHEFIKCRPQWLMNSTSRRPLELDLHCEELALSLEFDGYQHVVYPNNFHPLGSRAAFEKQRRLDSLKNQLCEMRGVTLIRVPWTCRNVDEMEGFVKEEIAYRKWTPPPPPPKKQRIAKGQLLQLQ